MLKFCVPYKIKGKEKDALFRAMSSVMRLGLDYDVHILEAWETWSLVTDLITKQDICPEQVSAYLKSLKYFIDTSNKMWGRI